MSTKLWMTTMLVLGVVTLIRADSPTGCSCTDLSSDYVSISDSPGSSLGKNKNCNANFAFTYTSPSSYGTGGVYNGCNCPTSAYSNLKAGSSNGRYTKKIYYNYTSCHGFGYNVADNYGPTPIYPAGAVACCNYCCGYDITTTTTTTTTTRRRKTTTTTTTTTTTKTTKTTRTTRTTATTSTSTASTPSPSTPGNNNDAGD